MEPRSLSEIAAACGGAVLRGSPAQPVRGVCTDSRAVQAGQLFVALRGRRFDGHQFTGQAIARGAGALLVETGQAPQTGQCPVVTVQNSRAALGKLAARYRQDFRIPLVAVGGSNGKTTTKDLLAAVLRSRLCTLSSPASFNNDIGLPLTLLELEPRHRAAVVELGTNHPGEMAHLMDLARPDYGVLTSIGREHLEFFKDLEGVLQEEGALAELLPPDGVLFVNGDLPQIERLLRRTRARVVRAGFSEGNDWRAVNWRMDRRGLVVTVHTSDAEFAAEYRVRLLGRHQVINALLAIAVGKELGLSRAEIRHGLTEFISPPMRLDLRESGGIFILDDTYNANADSLAAALETLAGLDCAGRRVAVLGDMAELGESAGPAHFDAGIKAAQAGVEHLFAVGEMAPILAAGARQSGLKDVRVFRELREASTAVQTFLQPGDLALLKGSRAARLEELARLLRSPSASM